MMKGEAVNENLINLYFKILEKINFVLLQVQDFLQKGTPGRPTATEVPSAEKVLFCNSNFIRKLRASSAKNLDNTISGIGDSQAQTDFDEMISWVKLHDVTLIPFFPEKQSRDDQELERTPTVLVSLTPS
jgi:hypothetical protein